jgi:hypothetical protein
MACGIVVPKNNAQTSPPNVMVTAYASVAIGKLWNEDGCIRIRSMNGNKSYALVWPPDVSATIEGDSLRVVTGIVRQKPTEVVLHFGEMVIIGGGESDSPDEDLLKELPPHCEGPYWVVGFKVAPYQPTEKP